MAASLFRFVGGAARNMIVANVFGSFMLLIFMVLGGYILVRGTTSPFFIKKKRIISTFFPYIVRRVLLSL
jgi:ABC-type multidrug transport system permease subunit